LHTDINIPHHGPVCHNNPKIFPKKSGEEVGSPPDGFTKGAGRMLTEAPAIRYFPIVVGVGQSPEGDKIHPDGQTTNRIAFNTGNGIV
jgi:hypothetical protein